VFVASLIRNQRTATDALRHAVRLDSEQPEPHYGLGLVYERRNMLTEAEQEMLTTLRLDPERLDARNMLGVIYARHKEEMRDDPRPSSTDSRLLTRGG
jgi:Flp pilus assembly protein TadD